MKTLRKQEMGLTLVEILLVFAIGAMIFILGLRQYEIYRSNSDVQKGLYNVDTLAQAASIYYWANCNGPQDATGGRVRGTLHPLHNPAPADPFPINITTDLATPGFISGPLNLTSNQFVDGTTAGGGYVVQFNRQDEIKYAPGCVDINCASFVNKQIGTSVYWRIQVSIKIKNPTLAKARAYQALFNADCVANASGSNVQKCSAAAASATDYLVFERSPSFPTPAKPMPLSVNQAYLREMSQDQRQQAMTDLLTSDHSTEYQYFLCGS